MNKIKLFCLYSVVLVSSTFTYAQRATNPLERKIIEKALDNFEMYKSCITVADDETRSYFLELFKDKSVPVYNDLLGITNKKDLNVSDYLNEQKANVVSPIIRISNVTRERIWEENGKWKVQLSFDKSLSYQNRCGVNFNTLDFYAKMFRETMILSYDENNQVCSIESITGKIDSNRTLPDDYCVLDSTNVKDIRVVYKHNDGTREKVKFNSFGQMLLTHGHEKNQFVHVDNDVVVKTNYQPECHLMTLAYRNYHWRIKPYFEMGLGDVLSIDNKSLYSSTESKNVSFGIDVGYIFPLKGKFKVGLFMGLGMSTTKVDLSYQSSKYSFNTNQDIDGDTYERIYENVNLSQSTKITEFSIPVYVDLDWRFSSIASFYMDLGLKLNINMSTSVNDFSGSAENVHGIYPQYDNLYLDYNWGYNGFTQQLNLTKDNLCNGENMSIKKFAPDLLLGAGFRFNIPHIPMAIDLGIGYQKVLGDLITVSRDVNSGNYNSQLVYNEYVGESSVEHVHDLLENSGKISRGFLKFNVGLLFKF